MSYRLYLNKSLDNSSLKAINRDAPEGVKYCNFLCQDYRNIDEFCPPHSCCRKCVNIYKLVVQKIEKKVFTLEQFKENHNIIHNDTDIIIQTEQVCNCCHQTKKCSDFEINRKICKGCRAIQSTERNKDIELHITNIENIKHMLDKLEDYVKRIPKDKLIKIISHFSVGRKSSDNKDRMVHNIVNHFRNLMGPNNCKFGCGAILSQDMEICIPCQKKQEKKQKYGDSLVEFEDKIDDVMKTLEKVGEFDYNIKKLYIIANKGLNMGLKKGIMKADLIEMINTELERRRTPVVEESELIFEDDTEGANHQYDKKYELEINGLLVYSRPEDGYVNATQLCKAGGKRIDNWKRLDNTREIITELCRSLNTEERNLMIIKKGGLSKLQGTWIHPDLAIQLAQWISPKFAIQVSRWIRELMIIGKVELGNEKNDKQLLLELQNKNKLLSNKLEEKTTLLKQTTKNLEETKTELKQIAKKHNDILKKKKRHELKRGPVFYILLDTDSKDNIIKVGIDNVSINARLKSHFTTKTTYKLVYLVYTEDCGLVEKNILKRYEEYKVEQNHEQLKGVDVKDVISAVRTLLTFTNMKYTEATQEELLS